MSARLAAIRDAILGAPRADGATLARALEGPLALEDVAPFVRFEAARHTRRSVVRTADVELVVSSWLPGQSTSLHGHGDATTAFRVVRGAATERVLGERDRVWAPGSVVARGGPVVHQLLNAGPDPLVTLHACTPPADRSAPPPRDEKTIVIVGGGFSAAALVCQLLARGADPLRVHVVEAGPGLGHGIAYAVEHERFRLNVPASKMSLDPAAPDEFVRFARAEATPGAFLSRALYGRYVTARLASALRSRRGKVVLWRDEAVSASDREVVLRSGRRLAADAVVLATGLAPRVSPAEWHPAIVDAWDECGLATLPSSGELLLVGSGLSALDVLAFLDARGFAGRVTLVSPHGLLPLPHHDGAVAAPPRRDDVPSRAPRELRPLMRWVRTELASADEPWQVAFDRLRPHVAALYGALSERDRARFARHVRAYWNVVRHRAPPDALALVARLQSAARLERVAGRVAVVSGDGPGVAVEIRERSGTRRERRFDAMVRCIGPALTLEETSTPLLRSLIEGGHARVTADGLGIETRADGRVVDARGAPSERLFGIGAARRASHWETTSVPDIAVHAQELARVLVTAIERRPRSRDTGGARASANQVR